MITFAYYVFVVWLALNVLLFSLVFLSAIVEAIADNHQTRMQAHIDRRDKMLTLFKRAWHLVKDFRLVVKITW